MHTHLQDKCIDRAQINVQNQHTTDSHAHAHTHIVLSIQLTLTWCGAKAFPGCTFSSSPAALLQSLQPRCLPQTTSNIVAFEAGGGGGIRHGTLKLASARLPAAHAPSATRRVLQLRMVRSESSDDDAFYGDLMDQSFGGAYIVSLIGLFCKRDL